VSVGQEPGQQAVTPLISIVIPVYNVDAYLAECLDSILRQDFRPVEVIAVDGGSTDNSGGILDKRAIDDSRLTVRHTGRIGPGQARNIGAEAASGDYIWFVDGDDRIADGCLPVIADRLARVQPDVLFTDHELSYPGGMSRAGYDHDLISRAPASAFTLAEQPWVVNLSMASWNKIYQREFFRQAGTKFSEQWPHEDVPVSCLLPLAAKRLSVLRKNCYHYRKGRPGSAMVSGDQQRHFSIFTAYEIVFKQVRTRLADYDATLAADMYRAYFERAIWHYSTIFDTGALVAGPDRRRYFETMHSAYRRYQPAGYRPGRNARGAKYRLIKWNAYHAYALLAPLNDLRVRTRAAS
jgi:CDP-glycerol glycerophosphotransferase